MAGAIIAAGQTGIDTVVVNIAVAAMLFGVALSLALLTGLGGRQVAGELAAGRAWRSSLRSGDRIRAVVSGGGRNDEAPAPLVGVVVDVLPTAVELDSGGTTVFVPNSRLLDSIVERDRPADARRRGRDLEAVTTAEAIVDHFLEKFATCGGIRTSLMCDDTGRRNTAGFARPRIEGSGGSDHGR